MKSLKMLKRVITSLLVIVLCFVVFGCEEKQITVNFETSGGSEIADVVLEDISDFVMPSDPVKEGYKFVGWYLDADFTKEFESLEGIEENVCLYAKWEKEEVVEPSIKDNFDCISIEEALSKATSAGESGTQESYYVYGTIKEVQNSVYGSMVITDGEKELYVYGVYSSDKQTRYDALDDKPVKGDEVVLLGVLKTYNGEPEMDRGYLQAVKHTKVEIDESNYTEKNIKAAREDNAGSLVKLSGVVARITYANGKIPNGFFLVDNTGSIYVYGKEIAGNVKEGNKITILGEKTYYVLDTEKTYAEKFGYKGACQIDKAVLVSNDKGNNDFDKSWIQEGTVKEIMETPVTENITSDIFKVNALIKKQENPGFVNYYIDDLDGVTGSYVYTQCNGSDFSWLDEFDGKICTVYLSAINAKSTSSGCVYRFIPVDVKFENYQFDLTDNEKVAAFALEYYAKGQFLSSYDADPALEVITNAQNELLGFNNVLVSYNSDNENVIYFETLEGKTVFHTKDAGTATIEITASYNGVTSKVEVTVIVNEKVEYQTITVSEAVNSADGTVVTVKGIVVSSLVNQQGFYLSDDTGLIAVVGNADDIKLLKPGNEVIIRGTKSHKIKENYDGKGQINIYNSEILVNNYGNHEYDTSKFNDSTTFEELYNLDYKEDHSNEVYILKGKVEFIESGYSTQVKLSSLDGKVKLTLYCSGGGQYSFVRDYAGQEGTFEVAICNWNSKTYYAACLISATYGDVKLINDLNFK